MFTSPIKWVIMFAPLAVIFAFGAGINRMSEGAAQGVFWLFSALMGLSMCLPNAAITLKDGVVEQSNFGDYPLLYLVEMPKVETVILPSDRPPQGCGEVSLPPMAPAVAQAIRRATGVRPRSMPLPQTVTEARALRQADDTGKGQG